MSQSNNLFASYDSMADVDEAFNNAVDELCARGNGNNLIELGRIMGDYTKRLRQLRELAFSA